MQTDMNIDAIEITNCGEENKNDPKSHFSFVIKTNYEDCYQARDMYLLQ